MIARGCKVGICAEVQEAVVVVKLRGRMFMLSLEQIMVRERIDIELRRSHRWRRGHGIVRKVPVYVITQVPVMRR